MLTTSLPTGTATSKLHRVGIIVSCLSPNPPTPHLYLATPVAALQHILQLTHHPPPVTPTFQA